MNPSLQAQFVDHYHNVAAPWTKTFWRGQGVAKCPLDLWIYQEIIYETKPDLLIETGTCIGGSALFFASIFDMIGHGEVITVDAARFDSQPKHDRITYLCGDSASAETIGDIRSIAKFANPMQRVMVALDSLHTYEHVAKELAAYGPMVTPGCYLVVEDTAVDASWGKPAAQAAAREFVAANPGFVIDREREKHLLTLNPDGWIRRVA